MKVLYILPLLFTVGCSSMGGFRKKEVPTKPTPVQTVSQATRLKNEIVAKITKYVTTHARSQKVNEILKKNEANSKGRGTFTYGLEDSKIIGEYTKVLKVDLQIIKWAGNLTYTITITISKTNLNKII